jgi:lysophospholipase L1-like esterase
MQLHPGWTVLNRGVNGERTDQIRARFDRDVLGERADVAIVIAGVNDVYQGRAVEDVQRELAGIYRRAVEAAVPVIAGSILPYDTATPRQNEAMRAVNAWIRAYAEAHAGIVFCDTRAAVALPDQPDRLAASPDGLHPSRDGYRLMALALAPVLVRLLARNHSGGRARARNT